MQWVQTISEVPGDDVWMYFMYVCYAHCVGNTCNS